MNKSFKIVLLLFIILYSGPLAAQKFGYIDSEYILNKHPDYKLVQDELKKLSEEWKKEFETWCSPESEIFLALENGSTSFDTIDKDFAMLPKPPHAVGTTARESAK